MTRRPDMRVIGPSSGTRPERLVHALLSALELRYVPNDRSLPGSPDAALHSLKVAIFTDGRFWHDPAFAKTRCRRHHRTDFHAKALVNRRRDRRQNYALIAMGWKVIRIWDSSLKPGKASLTLLKLASLLIRPTRRTTRIIRL